MAPSTQARLPQLAHIPDGQSGEEAEKVDPSAVESDLGLALTPVEDTLSDMATSLLRLGLAVPAGAGAEAKVADGQAAAEGAAKA